jgi:hypothetical protein
MGLIAEIRDAEEGGYCTRALGHAIFTEAKTCKELRENVLEAVALRFEDTAVRPRTAGELRSLAGKRSANACQTGISRPGRRIHWLPQSFRYP